MDFYPDGGEIPPPYSNKKRPRGRFFLFIFGSYYFGNPSDRC
jgi:hypothetical protein